MLAKIQITHKIHIQLQNIGFFFSFLTKQNINKLFKNSKNIMHISHNFL